jgi:hypothetical protein
MNVVYYSLGILAALLGLVAIIVFATRVAFHH